jgi:hypothetical protein
MGIPDKNLIEKKEPQLQEISHLDIYFLKKAGVERDQAWNCYFVLMIHQ